MDAAGCGHPVGLGRIGGLENGRGPAERWHWPVRVSLIGAPWLQTAAHCFEMPLTVSQGTVYLGVNNLSDLKNPKAVLRRLQQVLIHPDFTGEGSIGDIALAQMKRPVTFTPSILPVCLPSQPMTLPEGTLCWAIHLLLPLPLSNPETLQKEAVALVNSKKCESMYQNSIGYNPKTKVIKEDMFCAGYKGGKKDTCQGDSGGPLVCSVKGVWVQGGIVA
ncbi:Belongs to the peptidase S1 family [Pristimantis euphronides]